MSRCYENDDRVFQTLRAAGKTSWDEQADPNASFDRFVMRLFLEESLAPPWMNGSLHGRSALEIGCGSGPICCFLAAAPYGMTVRGIDVSPTALEMARQNAAQRGITNVRFDAVDVCTMPDQPDRYDLIIDGHCLHCLVSDEYRSAALATIHRLLKPRGLLLIETMISHSRFAGGAKYLFDPPPRCVLSISVDDPAGVEGAFMSGGEWFAPYRRLQTEELMLKELRDDGFAIHSQRVVAQHDASKPMLMQIRAGLLPS